MFKKCYNQIYRLIPNNFHIHLYEVFQNFYEFHLHFCLLFILKLLNYHKYLSLNNYYNPLHIILSLF